jgi:hypothetical protein
MLLRNVLDGGPDALLEHMADDGLNTNTDT